MMSQPQCGRCHRAGTGQAPLEVIGSKRSYALNWCKPNNDDADDVFVRIFCYLLSAKGIGCVSKDQSVLLGKAGLPW